jgi:hypothetical protein
MIPDKSFDTSSIPPDEPSHDTKVTPDEKSDRKSPVKPVTNHGKKSKFQEALQKKSSPDTSPTDQESVPTEGEGDEEFELPVSPFSLASEVGDKGKKPILTPQGIPGAAPTKPTKPQQPTAPTKPTKPQQPTTPTPGIKPREGHHMHFESTPRPPHGPTSPTPTKPIAAPLPTAGEPVPTDTLPTEQQKISKMPLQPQRKEVLEALASKEGKKEDGVTRQLLREKKEKITLPEVENISPAIAPAADRSTVTAATIAETTPQITSAARHEAIQNIASMIEKMVQVITGDRIETTVTLKEPPMFNGVQLVMTEFKSASKEFNITFNNLTNPEARALIESRVNQDGLRNALVERGYTLHMITIESKPEIRAAGAESKGMGKGGGQQQRGEKTEESEAAGGGGTGADVT